MEELKEEIKPQKIDTKGQNKLFLVITIVIFFVVISMIMYLVYANYALDKSIETSNKNTKEFNNQIASLKEKQEVVVYDIVYNNKKSLETIVTRSDASKYINELVEISKKYKIAFLGFEYSQDKVSTSATYISKERGQDAVVGVEKFIKEFRDGSVELNEGKKSIFILEPISQVNGDYLSKSFGISFRIEDQQ